jgi:O-antigen/teichoic acid export membrane protein
MNSATPPPSSRFGHRVRSGVRWQLLAQVVEVSLAVGMTVLLARVVGPQLYGIVLLAYTVASVVSTVISSPVGSSIVAQHLEGNDALSVAWWLAVLPALALFPLLAVGAVAYVGDIPAFASWIAVAAWLPLQAAAITSMAVLQRSLSFRPLALAQLTAAIIASGASLALVIAGHGLLALVVRILAIPTFQWLLCLRAARWRPKFTLDRDIASTILRYVRGLAGFNVLNQIMRRGDNLIVGSALGTTALAYYAIGYRFLELPVGQVGSISSTVSLPALRTMPDNDRFKDAFLRVEKMMLWSFAPIGICCMFLGDLVVRDVLGAEWSPAGPVVQIFGAIALLQVVNTQVGAIYLTRDATGLMFRWATIATPVFLVGVFGGLPWGIQGVAWGYLAVNIVLFYPNWALPGPLIGLTAWQVLRAIRIELGLAFILAGGGAALRVLITSHSLPTVLVLAGLTSTVYWIGVLALDRPLRVDALSILRRRVAGESAPVLAG